MALVRMYLLSTSQLTKLFFGAKGTCQKRMRRLFDAGLVRPLVVELAAENRYAITRIGYAYLEKAWAEGHIPPFRQPPRIDRRGLEHVDLLNEVRIAMALGAPRCGVRLARFVPDRELRANAADAAIIPDAAIVLSSERRTWQLALEVDTGTESAPVFGRKLLRYQTAADQSQSVFGMKSPVVLVVTLTERRARTLARQAVAVRATNVVFSWRGAVTADGGLLSGLSNISDLTEGMRTAKVALWSRGLTRPEGIPTR